MKILISDAFDPSLPGKLAAFGEVTDDKEQVAEVDVVLVRSKTKCDRDYIDRAKKLRLVIRGGVGLDNIDVDYARSKGVQVFNTAEASAVAVAELAFALMIAVPSRLIDGHVSMTQRQWLKKELKRTELMGKTLGLIGAGNIGTELARRALAFALMIAVPSRLVDGHVSMTQRHWLKKELKRTELMGKTLGLIGAGNIGTELARRALAFGMRVIAYDPLLKGHELVELVRLEELFRQADYLSLHVPLTDETRGMINRETIATMKDGVVIVNTARGKCVAEADVAEALKSGKLRAYATDVFYSDPPDPACPLYDAPNVVMTPHIGASSTENLLRIGDVVVHILEDFDSHTA